MENEIIILHPALDIKEFVACVSFRQRVVQNGKVTDSIIHFLSFEDGIIVTTKETLTHEQYQVVFDPKMLASDTIDIEALKVWAENPTPPNAHELFENLKTTLRVYIELPESSYGLLSAWIIGTYLYRAFPSFPYISFLGPKETGKSNTLECLKNLCFNAVKTKLTPASLGDTADSLRGTILIDQAHNLEGELKEILVDGYKEGGGKRRVIDISNNGRKVLEFDSYCPKVFASLEPLPDDLADRTFTINMAPASKTYPSPSASKRDWRQVKTDTVKLMLTTYRKVNSMIEEIAESEGNRFGELWLPIATILKLVEADETEVNEIKAYCGRQHSLVRYELNDWDFILVEIVANLESDEISAEELLSMLRVGIPGSFDDKKPGNPWLGKALKRLGLVKEKIGGKHHKTIYNLNKEQALKLLGGNRASGDNSLD